MISLVQFKRNAEKHAVCTEYKQRWDAATDTREVLDVALDIQGIEYVSNAIAEGWGISPEYVTRTFRDLINGKYEHVSQKGYTSQLYCQYEGEIDVRCTNLQVIDSHCVVNIPDGHICNLYVTGDSSVAVFNENGYAHVILYGNSEAVANGNGTTHITKAQ